MCASQFSLAVTCWVLTVATPALAQGVAGPLFGALRTDAGSRDKLNVQVSMAEAVDSEGPPEFRVLLPTRDFQFGPRSTQLAASGDYARNRRNVQLFGTASTLLRYDQSLDRIRAVSHSAQLGAGFRLPKQGSLQISQTAAYSPSYLYQLFPAAAPSAPGEPIAVTPEYRIAENESYSYGTRMVLAFGSPRGTRVTTTAEYGLTDFPNRTGARPELATYSTGAKISRALSRRGGFSVGYQYRGGQFALGGTSEAHRLTMGVEYSPALSVTRRATFRLEVAPSMLEIPASVPSEVERRLYRMEGEASVEYPFRLNWRATAGYRRSVEYLAVLSEPVFSNGARVNLTGTIGRRVDVLVLAGYATAASAIVRDHRNLESYRGEARIRYALTRALALYSEYVYDHYDLGGQTHLAPGFPGVYENHGIRAGFTLFAQALGR